jgi:hypothetical protein
MPHELSRVDPEIGFGELIAFANESQSCKEPVEVAGACGPSVR